MSSAHSIITEAQIDLVFTFILFPICLGSTLESIPIGFRPTLHWAFSAEPWIKPCRSKRLSVRPTAEKFQLASLHFSVTRVDFGLFGLFSPKTQSHVHPWKNPQQADKHVRVILALQPLTSWNIKSVAHLLAYCAVSKRKNINVLNTVVNTKRCKLWSPLSHHHQNNIQYIHPYIHHPPLLFLSQFFLNDHSFIYVYNFKSLYLYLVDIDINGYIYRERYRYLVYMYMVKYAV